ncbi:MAG: hypothetical protein WA609_11905 [Terriglobales bacterium]
MDDPLNVGSVADGELLSRVRSNPPGHVWRDAAKAELEFRYSERLIGAVDKLTAAAASTEKSGRRMEFATWVIVIATVIQLGLIVIPMSRGRHDVAQQSITKADSLSKSESLELQERCSNQAAVAFRRDGFKTEQGDLFYNHYNEKLNKCFVQYESRDSKLYPGTVYLNKVLSDAFEGKVFGTYTWHSDKDKKYWEVPPIACSVTLPSGEEKTCHSPDEYDSLVKQYME